MTNNAVPLLAGAALGLLTGERVRRRGGRASVIGAGLGLVIVAVVYPAARREHAPSKELIVEAGVVVASTVVAAIAAGRSPAVGRRLLAMGWAAHALFDFGQGPSKDSRLPGWYAPVCAGYDAAFAGQLLRG